jgi:hypothetical protein
MPLVVEILPVGVRSVFVTGETAGEQDAALVTWPTVRRYLDQLNDALAAQAPDLLDKLRARERSA